MICVFFVPGSFGTTVEHVLRMGLYNDPAVKILDDGSTHSVEKMCHLSRWDGFDRIFNSSITDDIITPIYPMDSHGLRDMVTMCEPYHKDHKWILLHVDDLYHAELNILFQYYKISLNPDIGLGTSIFTPPSSTDFKKWNDSHQSWDNMKRWEFREWFSLFYPTWVTEWIDAKNQVPPIFHTLSTREILNDPMTAFMNLLLFCDIKVNNDVLRQFTTEWLSKQQYIIEKHQTIEKIVEHTIENKIFRWDSLSLIEESMVQQKLRENRYEIQCDGLDYFPTSSDHLYRILDKL